MDLLDTLYDIKYELSSYVEKEDSNDEIDHLDKITDSINHIEKKRTRKFISDDQADDDLEEISSKISRIKRKMSK